MVNLTHDNTDVCKQRNDLNKNSNEQSNDLVEPETYIEKNPTYIKYIYSDNDKVFNEYIEKLNSEKGKKLVQKQFVTSNKDFNINEYTSINNVLLSKPLIDVNGNIYKGTLYYTGYDVYFNNKVKNNLYLYNNYYDINNFRWKPTNVYYDPVTVRPTISANKAINIDSFNIRYNDADINEFYLFVKNCYKFPSTEEIELAFRNYISVKKSKLNYYKARKAYNKLVKAICKRQLLICKDLGLSPSKELLLMKSGLITDVNHDDFNRYFVPMNSNNDIIKYIQKLYNIKENSSNCPRKKTAFYWLNNWNLFSQYISVAHSNMNKLITNIIIKVFKLISKIKVSKELLLNSKEISFKFLSMYFNEIKGDIEG